MHKFFKRSNGTTEQEPSIKCLCSESEESQTDHGAEDAQDSDKLLADTDSDWPPLKNLGQNPVEVTQAAEITLSSDKFVAYEENGSKN